MKVNDCICDAKQAESDCEIIRCPFYESDICQLCCRATCQAPIEMQRCRFKCATRYQYKQHKNSDWKDCLPSTSNWIDAMAKYHPTYYAIRITDNTGRTLSERIQA